jgi:flavin reductase (DIM6/NTAB) family NADH-FMN oxidoreductase RutF
VLGEDQMDMSNNFARSSEDKWDGVEHGYGENGCPVFDGSVAVLECDKHAMYEGGDHLIMVGEVKKMTYQQGESRPLLYFKGGYAKLA